MVTLWLWGIIVNLLTYPGYYDIALRDFGLSMRALTLRDLFPVASEEDKRRELTPDHQVLRELEGLDGEAEVEILYAPRPDYGRGRVRLRERGSLGIWGEADNAAFILRSELPIRLDPDGEAAHGVARVRAGSEATCGSPTRKWRRQSSRCSARWTRRIGTASSWWGF